MYKLKMKTKWTGPDVNRRVGELAVVPDAVGRYLVDSGQAELIEIISEKSVEPTQIESAIIEAPEKAVMPKPSTKKSGGR